VRHVDAGPLVTPPAAVLPVSCPPMDGIAVARPVQARFLPGSFQHRDAHEGVPARPFRADAPQASPRSADQFRQPLPREPSQLVQIVDREGATGGGQGTDEASGFGPEAQQDAQLLLVVRLRARIGRQHCRRHGAQRMLGRHARRQWGLEAIRDEHMRPGPFGRRTWPTSLFAGPGGRRHGHGQQCADGRESGRGVVLIQPVHHQQQVAVLSDRAPRSLLPERPERGGNRL
jgi:hypothetical protein